MPPWRRLYSAAERRDGIDVTETEEDHPECAQGNGETKAPGQGDDAFLIPTESGEGRARSSALMMTVEKIHTLDTAPRRDQMEKEKTVKKAQLNAS